MALLDFNSLVICNLDYNPESLMKTVDCFYENGIKNFIVVYFVDYDPKASHHRQQFLDNYKFARVTLAQSKPKGTNLKILPAMYLNEGALYDPFVNKLRPRGSGAFFLKAPIFQNVDRIKPELNQLMFKNRMIPVFACFEDSLKTCPDNSVNSLFKLHNAMFCLDINFIVNPDYEHLLHRSMTNKTTIIPAISNGLFCYPEMVDRFSLFRERVGDHVYLKLCKHINLSCARLWNLI